MSPLVFVCPGCSQLVEQRGRCPRCQRVDDERRGRRKTEHGRGTAHWRRVRAAVLARDGYRCQAEGCGSGANLTVHLDPRLDGHHELARPQDCVTLCRSCHGSVDAPRASSTSSSLTGGGSRVGASQSPPRHLSARIGRAGQPANRSMRASCA